MLLILLCVLCILQGNTSLPLDSNSISSYILQKHVSDNVLVLKGEGPERGMLYCNFENEVDDPYHVFLTKYFKDRSSWLYYIEVINGGHGAHIETPNGSITIRAIENVRLYEFKYLDNLYMWMGENYHTNVTLYHNKEPALMRLLKVGEFNLNEYEIFKRGTVSITNEYLHLSSLVIATAFAVYKMELKQVSYKNTATENIKDLSSSLNALENCY